MKLTCSSITDGIYRARCHGKVSVPDFGATTDPMAEVLGDDCFAGKILVSMEESTSIDSSGVSWLLRCHRACKDAGGCLVVHSVPPIVSHVLQLLRMDQVLRFADSEEQALSAAQGVGV